MPAKHHNQLNRLNRIAGQIQGVKKMIEEERYCVDILTQTKAISAALKKVELAILEGHLQHCVTEAIQAQDEAATQEKITEIMNLLKSRE